MMFNHAWICKLKPVIMVIALLRLHCNDFLAFKGQDRPKQHQRCCTWTHRDTKKTPADVQLACTFCEITLNTTRSQQAAFVFHEGETRTLRNATWSSVGLSWKAPSFNCLLSSVALKGVSENRTLSRMISLWLSRIKCETSPWESQTLLHILTESWRYILGVRVWKIRTFNRHEGSDERWCIMCCVMGIVGFGFWTLTITSD